MDANKDIERDLGFRDGVQFVVRQILEAENRVRPTQPYYARKLRELADEITKVITQ